MQGKTSLDKVYDKFYTNLSEIGYPYDRFNECLKKIYKQKN
ncbi:hypothetical protein CLM_0900 [Clostridium botulinum A2 str. Kyoto]|uniref:Uncharacterized protein n=1 Tax=Clostridium botulinum (strain Kyoto / Type A2) TaxID=536232 RepID=C1FUI2_CLOBJ|nr:hypothetical protein CLM_0900 [Clostridium botulinum A2 str. Kyoto]